MKKKTVRTLIIVFSALAVIAAGGYLAYRYAINFVFDKYILDATLSSVVDDIELEEIQGSSPEMPPVNSEPVQGEQPEQQVDVQQPEMAQTQPAKKLSKTEIAKRILRSKELTDKIAAMISYEEKKQIIAIVMSNFTADELTEIGKKVASGMDSKTKSELMKTAQSRLTADQWNQCVSIASKYIEKMRPYVE